jgi:glycerol-3-phosphate dehydrogenase (NAD(P)+)
MGLAGLGDLVLTCTGGLSRNRRVGEELGRGRTLAEVLEGMREVAEGVRTARALRLLAARRGVEMPITEEIHAVLYEGKAARAAVESLMTRPLREEFGKQ